MIADVVSSDVVGYATGASAQGFNFKAPVFTAVGYNTVDIQDIAISDGGADSIGYGEENFSIWSGLPALVAGSSFTYCAPYMSITGDNEKYIWVDEDYAEAAYSIQHGQGVVIDMNSDLTIQFAGKVPTEAVPFTTIQGFNFSGNPFPAAIDIQNIKISDDGADSIGYGEENFSIWEGLPSLVAGSSFTYCAPYMNITGDNEEYVWVDENYENATYSIPAGMGVVIDCNAGLTVSITPPYSL